VTRRFWIVVCAWAYSWAATPVPAGGITEAMVDDAIARIRPILPTPWEIVEVERGDVPFGWTGPSTCVRIRLEDPSFAFTLPGEEFRYRSFYKLWLLPPSWEGRMEVAAFDPSAPQALYLGENDRVRVLYRALGHNYWPEGPTALASALELDEFALTHSPKHSLDIDAMQILFHRLDALTGSISRWQQQIYGIAELPEMIYLELLTWEDRDEGTQRDPTFLGQAAEKETRFLARETLAAFPRKRGVYLRRVTQATFSDVLVVNPTQLAPCP
jgi:hypothetical protein